MATYPNDIIDDQLRKLGERDAEIASFGRLLTASREREAKLRNVLEDLKEHFEWMRKRMKSDLKVQRPAFDKDDEVMLLKINSALREATESEAKHE